MIILKLGQRSMSQCIPRCTHIQNLGFLPKKYKRYAPETMRILETRSKDKVTVTQKWYVTLRHPKKHPHTNFWILTSSNIRICSGLDYSRNWSEVKVIVTQNGIGHSAIPTCNTHTKFGIPTSKNIGETH